MHFDGIVERYEWSSTAIRSRRRKTNNTQKNWFCLITLFLLETCLLYIVLAPKLKAFIPHLCIGTRTEYTHHNFVHIINQSINESNESNLSRFSAFDTHNKRPNGWIGLHCFVPYLILTCHREREKNILSSYTLACIKMKCEQWILQST